MSKRLTNTVESSVQSRTNFGGNVDEDKDHTIVDLIDDLLTALRENRLVVPCVDCGYPVPSPITYDGEPLCRAHAPEPEVDDIDHPIEMEEPEDG